MWGKPCIVVAGRDRAYFFGWISYILDGFHIYSRITPLYVFLGRSNWSCPCKPYARVQTLQMLGYQAGADPPENQSLSQQGIVPGGTSYLKSGMLIIFVESKVRIKGRVKSRQGSQAVLRRCRARLDKGRHRSRDRILVRENKLEFLDHRQTTFLGKSARSKVG